jgi:hypothetical protein
MEAGLGRHESRCRRAYECFQAGAIGMAMRLEAGYDVYGEQKVEPGGELASTGQVDGKVACRGCQAASLNTWQKTLHANSQLRMAA